MLFSLYEYLGVLSLLALALFISCILFFLSYYLNPKNEDIEKASPYECGFDPFEDTKSRFDVKFYLISILFIIFDLEIMFLFPWAVVLSSVGVFGFLSMFLFLFVLTLGFVYEWKKGALDWD
jgi:NADH-quinone oxidoreductase subunit A